MGAAAVAAAGGMLVGACFAGGPGNVALCEWWGKKQPPKPAVPLPARKLNPHQLSRYIIIAGPAPELEAKALQMVKSDPERFVYYKSSWEKFPDGTDHIIVGGFEENGVKQNMIRGGNIIFLASFHNNDATMQQFHALTMLCESFIRTLTVVLPFYPTATMERISREGEIATANTLGKILSNLPNIGPPIRIMVYDLHTLQNRFYFGNNAVATLHSAFPMLVERLKTMDPPVDCVAFPDDGAEKRFKNYFREVYPDMPIIICGKTRDPHDPSKRTVVIKDGDVTGKRHIIVIDDMIQTGGTLAECAHTMLKETDPGTRISAFCTHGIFPHEAWRRFASGGDRAVFHRVYLTNSNPTVISQLPRDDCFEVMDLTSLTIADLDY